MGTLSLNTPLPEQLADRPGQTLRDKLADKGYTDADLDAVSNQLAVRVRTRFRVHRMVDARERAEAHTA